MKKCPELKYFDMRTIKHQIFYFPEAKVRLESLCELECDTSIDSSYFYGLSQYCQYIQRLIIVNMSPKPNHGIAKLIEVQKNLKHFEWKDDHYDDFLTEDPYEKIFLALEKKADSLNRLKIYFQYMNGTLLQEILPKFYKLKILVIDDFLFFTEEQLEQLRIMVYHELEVVNINFNQLNVISNIIENSGRYLKKILLRPYEIVDLGFDDFDFNENSLNFICKVYENCPSIEHLSIVFPPLKRHFTEFEKLLKICQNLKSLLIVLSNTVDNETHENFLKNGEELLKVLINSGPINLKEIRFGNGFRFSLGNWEEFLEKWRIRRALSIFTVDRIYMREDYTKLINKYKGDGVIRSFEYLRHVDLDNYCINDL
ncbi:21579_t:CDS:1 [Rhizophagus irregularis]|nr:21579_t:CDS:1 [Rhizophagus irregularis]